ncbi:MAG: aspartate aminotransferase family protein [Thermaerobacterales bacterium]
MDIPPAPHSGVPARSDVDSLLDSFGSHIGHSLLRLYRFMGLNTLEWSGEGAVCRDTDGKEYLDFNGCNGTLFHGRRHPRIIEAVRDQLDRLTIASRVFAHAPQIDLAERLAAAAPGDLQYTFFCNSGAEANEGALKLARAASGRTDFVATHNAFHGKTFGALSATGRDLYREPFQPLVPGFSHVPFGDIDAMAAAITDRTAAVILEPIQGEGGVRIPPSGYLRGIRELCNRRGVLLILDEVQTGLGRTGLTFECQREGVTPDIMSLAKILGGGVMPLGAFISRPEVFEPFDQNPYLHSSTFGGNPLACAAGIAALDATREEGLAEQAAVRGTMLLTGLQEIQTAFPQVIDEVRGHGLMIGIQLATEGLGGFMIAHLIQNGLIAIHSLNNERVLRFLPPAVVTEDQCRTALDVFANGIEQAAAVADEL